MTAAIPFRALKSEWMADPHFRDAYAEADLAIKLGIKVRELRSAMNLSVRELARLAGVSAAAVEKLELGSPDVRLVTVTRISKALGTRLVFELVPESAA